MSLGEINASRTLIPAIRQVMPDAEIVISTTTDTGYDRAIKLYGDEYSVFFFPFDFTLSMHRAFKRIRPTVCVLVELEIWPNFARIAKKNGAKIAVFNGRLSDKSFPRYKKIQYFASKMLANVDLLLVQTEQYAKRFEMLGVDKGRIVVTGNVKYDTAELTDKIDGREQMLERINLSDGQMLLTAGGTGPGEEQILLEIYNNIKADYPSLRLAIVPRKPERFDEVANMIEKVGFKLQRYSQLNTGICLSSDAVILGDTMGDLRKFYSISELIFVGRSLNKQGGSDMMEAVAMRKFTTFGPDAFNFKQTVDMLTSGNGAVLVQDASQLEQTIRKAISDEAYRSQIAEKGQRLIQDSQGATKLSADKIVALLS